MACPAPAGGSQALEVTSWSPVHHQGRGQPPPRSKPTSCKHRAPCPVASDPWGQALVQGYPSPTQAPGPECEDTCLQGHLPGPPDPKPNSWPSAPAPQQLYPGCEHRLPARQPPSLPWRCPRVTLKGCPWPGPLPRQEREWGAILQAGVTKPWVEDTGQRPAYSGTSGRLLMMHRDTWATLGLLR